MTRNDLLGEAVDKCLKELYQYVSPKVEWNDFLEENKEYSKKYKEWKSSDRSDNKLEAIGPAPYEFYYLPKDITKDIADSYIFAYKIDNHQNLLDIIKILKDYCNSPIVDKYIDDYTDEYGNHHPGYRGYDHPNNLEEEINTYLDLKFPLMDPERAEDAEDFENKLNTAAKELQDKFFEFLDMAGEFYNWNSELNSFSMSVYLGPSPNSNKNAVIKNWKEYRNKDIEINEEQIKKDYYGDNDE